MAARWLDVLSADVTVISSAEVPFDHVARYMTSFLESIYTARTVSCSGRHGESLVERHGPSKNLELVLSPGDTIFYYDEITTPSSLQSVIFDRVMWVVCCAFMFTRNRARCNLSLR